MYINDANKHNNQKLNSMTKPLQKTLLKSIRGKTKQIIVGSQ